MANCVHSTLAYDILEFMREISEMKFKFPLLSVCILFCSCVAQVPKNRDTFSAVTAFPGLTSLYLRMKIREPHLDPNTLSEDVTTKKRICESVTESVYFDERYKEDPITMDEVRSDLIDRMEYEAKSLPPSKLLAEVLLDYEEEGFTHRTRLVRFRTDGGDREEFAFACATQEPSLGGSVNVYYVSDSYNIRIASDRPTVGETRARFVCMIIASRCHLVALAEEVASAFPGHTYSEMYALQDIYWQMRKFYDVAPQASDDPLCGLSKWEKLRVCASVLNAPYFYEKVEFYPNRFRFEGACERQEILLLVSDEGEVGEEDTHYAEWMLSCPLEGATSAESPYLISRAYHSHYVFVYARDPWTKEWVVESICGNVSVVVESGEVKFGETPPNFFDLLKAKYSPIASSFEMEVDE